MNIDPYVNIYSSQSYGNDGSLGLKISVGGTCVPDFNDKNVNRRMNPVLHRCAEMINDAIEKENIIADKNTVIEIANNRKQLIDDVFGDSLIFVEEIPNGYTSQMYCAHIPWFIVTTKVGRIKIGWRKRVINIDWEDTVGTDDGQNIFSLEDSTVGDKYIHAWNVEDAKRYVKIIIESAND